MASSSLFRYVLRSQPVYKDSLKRTSVRSLHTNLSSILLPNRINSGRAKSNNYSILPTLAACTAALTVASTYLHTDSSVHSSSNHSSLRVGLCQLLVGANKDENLQSAQQAIEQAVKQGAKLVVLPEMFTCPYSNDSFQPYSEILPKVENNVPISAQSAGLKPETSKTSIFIAELAKKHKIYIVAGTIPECESNHLYNTSLVINPKGEFIAKHRKVHLFDINVPGKIVFKESDTLTPGNTITTFDTEYGKLGLAVCYDIRFPELAVLMGQAGCNMLIYPGAFNTTTGPAHWELLQRARAVDNQLYVLTCSPARNPESKYQAWGHSSVINPWGQVEATTEHNPAIVVADVDFNQVAEMRRNIPVLQQKRKDLYQLQNLQKK